MKALVVGSQELRMQKPGSGMVEKQRPPLRLVLAGETRKEKPGRMLTVADLDKININCRLKRPYAKKARWFMPNWNPSQKLFAYIEKMTEHFKARLAAIEEQHSLVAARGQERTKGDRMLEAESSFLTSFSHVFLFREGDGFSSVSFKAEKHKGQEEGKEGHNQKNNTYSLSAIVERISAERAEEMILHGNAIEVRTGRQKSAVSSQSSGVGSIESGTLRLLAMQIMAELPKNNLAQPDIECEVLPTATTDVPVMQQNAPNIFATGQPTQLNPNSLSQPQTNLIPDLPAPVEEPEIGTQLLPQVVPQMLPMIAPQPIFTITFTPEPEEIIAQTTVESQSSLPSVPTLSNSPSSNTAHIFEAPELELPSQFKASENAKPGAKGRGEMTFFFENREPALSLIMHDPLEPDPKK